MGQNQTPFQKDFIAELSNGDIIEPESAAEQEYLQSVAINDSLSDSQKDRLARLGTLIEPTKFDVNFAINRRQQYPTDLDPQLRQMIQEA